LFYGHCSAENERFSVTHIEHEKTTKKSNVKNVKVQQKTKTAISLASLRFRYCFRKKIPASHPHFGYSQLMVVLNALCVVHAKKDVLDNAPLRKKLLSRHS